MVRRTNLHSFQGAMRNDDPMRADMEAGGDFQAGVSAAVVERDPLTGQITDRNTERNTDAAPAEHEYDVEPDGIIRDWRTYGPGQQATDDVEPYEPTTHTITDDDEQRFSGGGATDDLPFGNESKLIPSDASFQNKLFKAAPELANIAERLIGEHGFLDDLRACWIEYKWRRKGGGSKGRQKIGYLKRVSAELTIYTNANFIVWLAADTARVAQFTDRQVEAALFHQLLHIDQDDKGNWIKVPHDFEGFGTEVRHYGPWTEDLKIGSKAFTTAVQMGLDFDADDDEDDDPDIDDEAEDADTFDPSQADLSDLPDGAVAEGLNDDL